LDANRSDKLRPAEPAIDGATEAAPSQRPRLRADVADFPSANSRSFNYFKPRRIRATVYEDVTVDVQPDHSRHLIADWAYAFAGRPGGYPVALTQAKSTDWHWFRDPNQEWERTIYRNNAQLVRMVEQAIANARTEGALDQWAPSWSSIVERDVGAWMHAEHGLGLHVFLAAQRDAPTNMINNAIAVNSIHKLRTAQDLLLFNLELSEVRSDFDGRAHLAAWHDDPLWLPVRETVERLTAIHDWCEAIVATNLAFEPLVGELFRSGYVMRTAAANGDFVTPTIMGIAESDFDRDLAYTTELLGVLAQDSRYAEANRKLLTRWLSVWVAASLRAARSLAPLFSQAERSPVDFNDALARVRARVHEILLSLDIQSPESLER
jgi:propane 2-monooxygenase small subunit